MVKKGKVSSTNKIVKKKSVKAKVVKKAAAPKKTVVKKKIASKRTVIKTTSDKKIVPKKKTSVKKTVSKTIKKAIPKVIVDKKKVVKKANPKKTSRRIKSLWEKTVSENESFYTLDKKKLNSIISLVKELEDMDEHVYHHHVSFQNNDFANWLEGVFELHDLATVLRESHTREETQLLLLKYIINNS